MAKKIANKEKVKAWEEFSRWVRIRDCLATRGVPFAGLCITCKHPYHIRWLQAGHFIPGRRNGVLFSEEGTNAQCRECNEFKHGVPKIYRLVMIEKYGVARVDEMVAASKKTTPNIEMNFPAIAKKYRDKYEVLIGMTWKRLMKE